jgi:hypothetical protein
MLSSQKKLMVRGVKFYFITKQDLPKDQHAWWQEAVLRSNPLAKWFDPIQFEYSEHPTLITDWQDWNLIKIFCSETHFSIKVSEVESFYKEVFSKFSEWFNKLCRDRRIDCKPYDFRVLFRLHPLESPEEFVPIPFLNDIYKKIVSPPQKVESSPGILISPPRTPEEMFNYAKKALYISDQMFEIMLQSAKKDRIKVFGSYGVRNEKDSNTYEFDMVMPSLSEEVAFIKNLKGEPYHQLILQFQGEVTRDFNNIVRSLIAELLQNGLIDNKKIEEINNNPGEYFEMLHWRTRFILKFDIRKMDLSGKSGMALDFVKKHIQKQLKDTTSSLFGVFSYKLSNDDLTKIEEVKNSIVYFKKAKPEDLFTNFVVILVDRTYDRIVEIARKTDEILSSHKIIDLNSSPSRATNIEDAKQRWISAVSDCEKNRDEVASFIFFKEIIGIPLQHFTSVQESLKNELSKIAVETSINVTITSDNQPTNTRYGCYVTSTKA